jgi:nucleoside-diphosphate-sugar epimerase
MNRTRDGCASDTGSTVLVTGCAGFLGSHLCETLLADGLGVVGLDCFSDYYPRALKQANLEAALAAPRFHLVEADLATGRFEPALDGVDVVFHLAAQPGVRPSFGESFGTYLRHNVHGTQRLLEAACGRDLKAFVYASSASPPDSPSANSPSASESPSSKSNAGRPTTTAASTSTGYRASPTHSACRSTRRSRTAAPRSTDIPQRQLDPK